MAPNRTVNQTMLDGIDVDVVGVPSEVGFDSDGVLPRAPLPDAALAPGESATLWENIDLINRQRVAKSASLGHGRSA